MSTESQRQAFDLEDFIRAGKHVDSVYGNQWGDPDKLDLLRQVRDEFLLPNLRTQWNVVPELVALEIGAGGGRWSQYFVGRASRVYLVDATWACEAAIRSRFDWPGFEFVRSLDGLLPELKSASIDFAFSFDTFVHFEPPLFDLYLQEIGRVLKPNSKLVLHYAHHWPECEQSEKCFLYRDRNEVADALSAAGFSKASRKLELRCGYGSIVVETVKG